MTLVTTIVCMTAASAISKFPILYHTMFAATSLSLHGKDIASPLVVDPLKIGNASFSASVIEALLKTPAGDYKGFQTMLEAIQVRTCK